MRVDAELVRQTLNGDSRAANTLIRRYESAVFAVAMGVSGNHHLAEDVTQDAFVSAIDQLSSLREPELFGGWVLTITKRMAIRASKRRQKCVPLADHHEVDEIRAVYYALGLEFVLSEDDGLLKVLGSDIEAFASKRKFVGRTAKGIRIGDHRAGVMQAYGEPTRIRGDEKSPFVVIFGDKGVVFSFDEDLVSGISVRAPN